MISCGSASTTAAKALIRMAAPPDSAMPITPAERGILEQMFDEVLTKSSLDVAFTAAQRMVELGVIEKGETKLFRFLIRRLSYRRHENSQ